MSPQPKNLGELRRSPWSEEKMAQRTVRQELRENLLQKLEKGEPIFPGVHGYDDTVIPQIINAVLSRHHFILLGLRGQAKSRILRGLVAFLDPQIPVVAGCEINDNPYRPICRVCRERIAAEGDATPIAWLGRDQRYVEKLATPDVTIADMIGDVDPIKAARGGTKSFRRADHPLRPAAPRQSRYFCHQRAARSRREDSGRPVQYHARGRHPD